MDCYSQLGLPYVLLLSLQLVVKSGPYTHSSFSYSSSVFLSTIGAILYFTLKTFLVVKFYVIKHLIKFTNRLLFTIGATLFVTSQSLVGCQVRFFLLFNLYFLHQSILCTIGATPCFTFKSLVGCQVYSWSSYHKNH